MFVDTMAQGCQEDIEGAHRQEKTDLAIVKLGQTKSGQIKLTLAWRRSKLALALSLSLGLCGCIYDGEVTHGYQLDQRSLDQIKTGSSAEQVLVVMGYPSTTSTVGGDAWYYVTQVTDAPVRFMKPHLVDQHVLAVYFDKDKKVQRVANYGIKDGQIFDFVSRTTPTGGSEGAVVNNLFKTLLHFG